MKLQNPKRKCAALILLLIGSTAGPLQADVDTPVEDTAYLLCGGCHGPTNIRTMEDMSPNIIGQKKDYLAKQLKAYRDRARIHPDMNDLMQPYSDKNIEDLATYYANTSVDLPGSAPANPKESETAQAQNHAHHH
jgi:cytochrome c553